MLDFWYQVPGISIDGGLKRLLTYANSIELLAWIRVHKRLIVYVVRGVSEPVVPPDALPVQSQMKLQIIYHPYLK